MTTLRLNGNGCGYSDGDGDGNGHGNGYGNGFFILTTHDALVALATISR